MGQNFHYEVTNRYLMIAFTEVIKYHSVTGKKAKNDILAFHLHESLKQIMDFKLQNGMLDFKTYIAILEADLKTLRQFDPITVLD